MNKIIFLIISVATMGAYATTDCLWRNHRDNFTFETVSSVKGVLDIKECFEVLKPGVVITEPIRYGSEFEGEMVIRDIRTNQELYSCPTQTVKGLDANESTDQGRLILFWQDVQSSGDPSGATTKQSKKWQNYFNSKIRLTCP